MHTGRVVRRQRQSTFAGAVALVALWLLAGCGDDKKPPQAQVVVSIQPGAATLGQAQTQNFVASVTGASDGRVSWSLDEGAAAGSISSAGVYTAPYAEGTFHLTARSVADTSKSATVPITVRLVKAQQTVGVEGGTITLPGGASMVIPPGALATGAAVTLAEAVAPVPAALNAYGPLVTCEPSGIVFSQPVQVSLPLPAGTSSASLAWTRYGFDSFASATAADFELLGGRVEGGKLIGTVSHCSGGAAVPASSTRTLSGVARRSYYPPGVAPSVVPYDLSAGVNVYPVDAISGALGPAMSATTSADGRFEASGLPASGEYLVDLGGGRYVYADADTVAVNDILPGRPDVRPFDPQDTRPAALSGTLSNLRAWNQHATASLPDFLELVSPGAYTTNFFCFYDPDFTGVGTFPADGATSVTFGPADLAGLRFCGTYNAIESAKGDRVYLAQVATDQTSTGFSYNHLVRWAEASPLDLAQGQSATVDLTLAEPTDKRTVDCDFRGSQFAATLPTPAGYSQSSTIGNVLVLGMPFPATLSTEAANADFLDTDNMLGDVRTGPMEFALADPAQLSPVTLYDYRRTYQVSYQGGRPAGRINVGSRTAVDVSQTCSAPVTPVLSPVPAIALGGTDALQPRTDVQPGTVLSWLPPALGTAVAYEVTLTLLRKAGTQTGLSTVATFSTTKTRIPMPPGLLQVGKTYLFQITARDHAGKGIGTTFSYSASSPFTVIAAN